MRQNSDSVHLTDRYHQLKKEYSNLTLDVYMRLACIVKEFKKKIPYLDLEENCCTTPSWSRG